MPRLRLATDWQLAVVAVIMGGLLFMIFPRETLIAKLYDQDHLDELTLSYIDNLQRVDPANVDLALLLGRAQRDALGVAGAERIAQPILARGDARQRAEARMLLLDAYERALDAGPGDAALRARLREIVEGARGDDLPPRLAGAFAAVAFRLELPEAGKQFLDRLQDGHSTAVLVRYADKALGDGRHALAAEYFLLARQQATDRREARELLVRGIEALMAASRFKQAMRAADRYAGDLADDPETLRFLIRTALAAGDPVRAAGYAKRLVFRDAAAKPQAAPRATAEPRPAGP